MEKDRTIPETDVSIPPYMEDTIEPIIEPMTAPPVGTPIRLDGCTHGRMIVLTREKKRSGKVRCLECGAIFDDPFPDSE